MPTHCFPEFKHSLQIFGRVELRALGRAFQKSNVSLLYLFQNQLWFMFGNTVLLKYPVVFKISRFLFEVRLPLHCFIHCAMHHCHWQQNGLRAWCYHHHARQLRQCCQVWMHHLYSSKQTACHCSPTAQSLFRLTKEFSPEGVLTFPCRQLQISVELEGVDFEGRASVSVGTLSVSKSTGCYLAYL